jgi:hypothetical protein
MHPDLARLADRVQVVDDAQARIDGRLTELAGPGGAPADPVDALSALLYRMYLRSGPTGPTGPTSPTGPAGPRGLDALARREFTARLSNTDSGRGTWQSGWRVLHRHRDVWVVRSPSGVEFQAARRDVQALTDVDGSPCRVRLPAAYRRLLSGFYLFTGDTDPGDGAAERPSVRVYWHLTSDAAPGFVTAVREALNAAGTPFRAKVLDDPHGYRRADAGVVYLAKHAFPGARIPLQDVYDAVRLGLREDVPLFTRPMAKGVALAEDPGGGQSFGENRCALLATALWDAHQRGADTAGERRLAVEKAFVEAGLDPDAPHLAPGSSDAFYAGAWMTPASRHVAASPCAGRDHAATDRAVSPTSVRPLRPDLLAAATAIGTALCGAAIWDASGARCTWVGRSTRAIPVGGAFRPQVASLGPDLYGGLAGVACFLAELFDRTGEDRFRRTAAAALRAAVAKALAASPPAAGAGLFVGLPGLALAAARVSTRVGEDLAGSLCAAMDGSGPIEPDSEDVVSGSAGAVLAHLALADHPGWSAARSRAVAAGERLRRSPLVSGLAPTAPPADRGDPGDNVPLTGLAHGAAGIAVALLSLYARNGDVALRDAGRRAFGYEDALFDPDAGNWPDLRPREDADERSAGARFMVAWCHGAAGIALCRLRAAELDEAERAHHLAIARVALDTTLATLERRAPLDVADVTLCHGLTGLVEALWVGHSVLGEDRYAAAARGVADELAGHVLAGRPTVSGVLCGGPSPALMVGSAGVGYQLLRISDPGRTPPLLLPRLGW